MTQLRLACSSDAGAILAIYAPIVRDTTISFELEVPSVDEIRARIESTIAHLPWLVAERENGVVGYAYASRYRDRAAYRWSVEVSAYVAEDARGSGVGRALYVRLLDLLTAMSFRTALAAIALPNAASVALHEAMGFTAIGAHRRVGFKHGVWCDVGWWQRDLHVPDGAPHPIRPLREVLEADGLLRARAACPDPDPASAPRPPTALSPTTLPAAVRGRRP